MHDAGKVLIGIAIFLLLLVSPVLYNAATGKAAYRPDPKIVTEAKECVAPTEYMKSSHMTLLNEWRDAVVRQDERVYTAANGKKYVMSLTSTCLDCHRNKKEFCDSCHNYMGVTPYCWGCHLEPKEGS